MTREPKQVIVIRKDLKMRRGKEIAQGAHASLAWLADRFSRYAYVDNSFSDAEHAWIRGSFTKVVCQVSSEAELLDIYDRATAVGVTVRLITDAGRTEFGGVPTRTALAVGPDWDDVVDGVTGGLKLY